MISIPKGYVSQGRWCHGWDNGHPVVILLCPGCGALGYLSETHEIGSDGKVSPSVECECGFHDHICLEGYAEASESEEE